MEHRPINQPITRTEITALTFFENLEAKDIPDNTKFWKTFKPFVANTNSNSCNKITLYSKKMI